MSSEWSAKKIGDICTKVFSGGTPTSTNPLYYVGGTIPWLRTKEVNYSKIFAAEQHITELGFENSSVNLVPVNSVIVAMYGNGDTAGRVAINKVPLATNQACCNLVINSSLADYRFVYYYLMGQYKALVDLKNGGAQQNLNGNLIKSFPINIPALPEQINIAALLESLDDRITLLRETNTTLEAIAQALFKSWFVDFDPVHAKQQGRAPEGMDAQTAALFPDSFEESELGMVPKGWGVAAFSKICTISSGKRPIDRADFSDEFMKVPLYGGAGVMGFTSKSLFDSSKILTGRVGTLGKIHIAHPPFWASDNVLVISPNEVKTFIFSYFWMSSIDLIALNRGSTQPLLTQKDLGAQVGVIPSAEVLEIFERLASIFYEKVSINLRRINTLANLRDTLLPRLISGQLCLPESTSLCERG